MKQVCTGVVVASLVLPMAGVAQAVSPADIQTK